MEGAEAHLSLLAHRVGAPAYFWAEAAGAALSLGCGLRVARDGEQPRRLGGEHQVALDLEPARHEQLGAVRVAGYELEELNATDREGDPGALARLVGDLAGSVLDDGLVFVDRALGPACDLPVHHRVDPLGL